MSLNESPKALSDDSITMSHKINVINIAIRKLINAFLIKCFIFKCGNGYEYQIKSSLHLERSNLKCPVLIKSGKTEHFGKSIFFFNYLQKYRSFLDFRNDTRNKSGLRRKNVQLHDYGISISWKFIFYILHFLKFIYMKANKKKVGKWVPFCCTLGGGVDVRLGYLYKHFYELYLQNNLQIFIILTNFRQNLNFKC
ncbi:hypothetical protein AGLY_011432 [Aphis glycines]|uniref:Uncharacterized protein n=1 Tax=Aphis glycines TaxID=307491 RepID=A0A6G0TDE9_APHGL|nr:hypothetical protein AGLY_011432 [Aphis glycines]